MSVVKNKRSISKMEFFHNAIALRKSITDLLLRDFGIKDFAREIKFVGNYEKFTAEEKQIVENIFDSHEMGKCFVDEYPMWLIEKERAYFMDIGRELIKNIVRANTIYPVNMSEYYMRRNSQNKAIANCEDLLQEMQYIISIVPVNAQKYMSYVEMIEREIALLKGWRKSDNKLLEKIQ